MTSVPAATPVPTPALTRGFGHDDPPSSARAAARWLRWSAAAWLAVAITGQLLFGVYVLGFYGATALRGDVAQWSRVMPRGWTPGDHAGNTAIAVHLLVALVICAGGVSQLVPAIRRRAPAVHRWMGRAFVVSAALGATSGFWLQWVRGSIGSTFQRMGTTTNGVLILACAWMAWRTARSRAFGAHRRWALRLFLLANGVWFFRVGLMFSLLVFGPVGFDPKTFRGPLMVAIAWGETIVPVLVLELWLRAERARGAGPRWAMSAALLLLTVATGVGVTGAMLGLWLPRLR